LQLYKLCELLCATEYYILPAGSGCGREMHSDDTPQGPWRPWLTLGNNAISPIRMRERTAAVTQLSGRALRGGIGIRIRGALAVSRSLGGPYIRGVGRHRTRSGACERCRSAEAASLAAIDDRTHVSDLRAARKNPARPCCRRSDSNDKASDQISRGRPRHRSGDRPTRCRKATTANRRSFCG
jgi:hypothetical protein